MAAESLQVEEQSCCSNTVNQSVPRSHLALGHNNSTANRIQELCVMHLYSNKQSSRRSLGAINIDDYFSGNKYKINHANTGRVSFFVANGHCRQKNWKMFNCLL